MWLQLEIMVIKMTKLFHYTFNFTTVINYHDITCISFFLISSVLISSIGDIIYAIKASGIDSTTMPNIHLLLNSLLTVSLSTILLMLHRYHYHYFFFIRIICNHHLCNHNITVVFHHNNLQHNICWCISLLSFPCFFFAFTMFFYNTFNVFLCLIQNKLHHSVLTT